MKGKISMIKIEMDEIEGSFKMGQNGTTADRDSVSDALARVGIATYLPFFSSYSFSFSHYSSSFSPPLFISLTLL